MTILHNFIINEALYGWNVRFYLAALLQLSDGSSRMEVAYEVCLQILIFNNFDADVCWTEH